MWFLWLLGGGVGGGLLLLVWAAVIEPRLLFLEEEQVQIPALPAAWDGQRIGLIADPQVGLPLSSTDTFARAVRRLVEIRPTAVCIAGDFMNHVLEHGHRDTPETVEELGIVAERLRPLTAAGIPTYAVLGNHDYGMNAPDADPQPLLAKKISDMLAGIGVRVLQNDAVELPLPGGNVQPQSSTSGLWLVGIGPSSVDRDNVSRALGAVPAGAARIVLMHEPATFRQLPAHSAPLAMAGHTHGGQVRFPWLLLRRLLGRPVNKQSVLRGWVENQGEPGNRLYVNRGIGFSRLPVRFNAPPEITLFTLHAEPR